MLYFQQLTQLNLVIVVKNTLTQANFNLSDPAVAVNERAVTSRHRHEEDTKNPRLVSASTRKAVNGHNLGSSKMNECSLLSITTYLFIYICLHGSGRVSRGAKNRLKMCPGGVISHRAEYRDPGHIWWQQTPVCGYTGTNVGILTKAVDMSAVGAL